jgi:hypothetical protein
MKTIIGVVLVFTASCSEALPENPVAYDGRPICTQTIAPTTDTRTNKVVGVQTVVWHPVVNGHSQRCFDDGYTVAISGP